METISALLALCAENSPLTGEFPHKGALMFSRGALMFSLICAWTNGWVNNRYGADLRRHRAQYDVSVMWWDKMRWKCFQNSHVTFYIHAFEMIMCGIPDFARLPVTYFHSPSPNNLIFYWIHTHLLIWPTYHIWRVQPASPLQTLPNHDDVIKRIIFRVTGPLFGEFTGHWWIPLTKASDAELWSFLWSAPEQMVK